jgi:hypothetical protein
VFGVEPRASTSCTALSPGSSKSVAHLPAVLRERSDVKPAPARSSATRRAAVSPVTATAAHRSSSAVVRRMVRAYAHFRPRSEQEGPQPSGLKMALSSKAKDGAAIVIVDNLDVKDGKTKVLAGRSRSSV